MSIPIHWLDEEAAPRFPPVEEALDDPDGLLAAGGRLQLDWLLTAYRSGIFPWYSSGQPVLWWSPNPRVVLTPDTLKVSRSLNKLIKKQKFRVSIDRDFPSVIEACAAPRQLGGETWITEEMQSAYTMLHNNGYAHSVEVWEGAKLVGGLYGVALGRVFFGESMFSKESNASKIALVHLVRQLERWGFELIDCQIASDHLFSLGAIELSRLEFTKQLRDLLSHEDKEGPWTIEENLFTDSNEYKLQSN